MLQIEKTSHDDLRIRFRNLSRLTAGFTARMKEEIAAYLDAPCRCLNVDMEGIHFVDAKSFEMLLRLHESLESRKIKLQLRNVSDEILELLDIMQLTDAFHIERTPGLPFETSLS